MLLLRQKKKCFFSFSALERSSSDWVTIYVEKWPRIKRLESRISVMEVTVQLENENESQHIYVDDNASSDFE